jgi:hypothetical protein
MALINQDPGVHQRFGSSRTTIPNPELQAETGKNAEIGNTNTTLQQQNQPNSL